MSTITSKWTITTKTYKIRSFLLLSHTSGTRIARSMSYLNWNHTKYTHTHWNTLFYTLLNTWTHFKTHLNTHEHTLNHNWTLKLWKIRGLVTVFFSSIYTFLEQQFLQLSNYFLHFEFQIIKRSGSIQNNNFLGDDNTCHLSFQIINKPLLNSSSRSNCFVTIFRSV